MRNTLFIFLGLLSIGCTVGPDYRRPNPSMPASFASTQPATTQPADATLSRWWTTLEDPTLTSLIEQAIASNHDLRIASLRVREARAMRSAVSADLSPQVGAGGGYTHTRSSENAPPISQFPPFVAIPLDANVFQTGFDASWEIDVFGGRRRAVEAADADVAGAVEGARDTLVSVAAEVARNYVELRGLQRQLATARLNLDVQERALDLVRKREKAGVNSQFDLSRAQAQVSSTASLIPMFEAAVARAAHRLAVLVGKQPQELAPLAGSTAPIPPGPTTVPVGLPSDLLRRRLDIRRAERELAAATARIGVATAELYPRFSLTGSLGLASEELSQIGRSGSLLWSAGGRIVYPLFEGGRTRARIAAAGARAEQAMVRYEKTILVALAEVESALVSYQRERQRRASLLSAAESSRKAVEHATTRYTTGEVDLLVLLDAVRTLIQAEDQLAQGDTAAATTLVALYKSLGGGWEAK